MIFTSPIFLFWFLPAVLVLHYAVPIKARNAVLLAFSYLFYGWWRFDFAVLMVASTVVDFGVGQWLGRIDRRLDHDASLSESARARLIGRRRFCIIASLVANLGLLAYFKYMNFGIDSLNAILAAAGFDSSIDWPDVVLPVGISFYTFQTLSYTIDVYRREVEPARNILDFATFVALFPQLVAGPIVRYRDLADQLVERHPSLRMAARGAWFFMIGFAKKVLFADLVAHIADDAFAAAHPGFAQAWLGTLAYGVQIYFDFSGYSDMAIGLGLLFGFQFVFNFDSPYQSQSITEFWRRWHISLSTWLRDYLYVPLGGNRRGERRTYLNLFLTMLLGGLWHGASWTFVIWGAYHGLLLAFERAIGKRPIYSAAPRVVRMALTFVLVMIGWVFFRAHTIGDALHHLGAMFGLAGGGDVFYVAPLPRVALAVGIATVFFMPNSQTIDAGRREWLKFALALTFLIALPQLLFESYHPFLYFQF